MHDEPPQGQRRRRRVAGRAERLAQSWAGQVHAELLTAWASTDAEAPLPDRATALFEARRRVAVLVAGLGPLAEISGDVLDVPYDAAYPSWRSRGWTRNAHPRRDDDGPDWLRDLFDL